MSDLAHFPSPLIVKAGPAANSTINTSITTPEGPITLGDGPFVTHSAEFIHVIAFDDDSPG
jgi:hypothetical protein